MKEYVDNVLLHYVTEKRQSLDLAIVGLSG